jgi:hypothetical protein
MKWTVSVCLLLLALTGCNAAKVNSQSQYVPVPAVTGQWTIAASVGGSTSTIQANLVSVPCSSIDSLTYTPMGGGNATVSSWALSCSLADNLTGSGSITGTAGTFYDPPKVLVVATGTGGPTTSPYTTMNFWLLECSGTSTECYQPWVIFSGQGTLTTPSTSLSGSWECQGSTPCYGQSGTLIATQP